MDTLIIGGGPAGLMASCFCTGHTLIIDRLSVPGRKLLSTGGGRCNLTHATDAAGIMAVFGRQARFMGPSLQAFPPSAICDFFRRYGVDTREEPDGCIFPVSQKASDVLTALERAAHANGVEIRGSIRAKHLIVERNTSAADPAAPALRIVGVETDHGILRARRVILAAGGQSYPNLGSDGSGFALAREVGLSVIPPVPALAGLVTRETWPASLAGIVQENASLRLEGKGLSKQRLCGPLLFTHKGISGPPALAFSGEIAAYLLASQTPEKPAPDVTVRASFFADRTTEDWLARFEGWRKTQGGRALHNVLSGEVPRALAAALCEGAGVSATAVARVPRKALVTLANACADMPLHIVGTEDWSRAMLTRGGIALNELNPDTLACKRIAGLACAGEIVDLDGPCGGYNLTWAFASGRRAALFSSVV